MTDKIASAGSVDAGFSRLMLGTVQFGLPYGVANRRGQPTYHEVVEILAAAAEGGVNCCDTAAIYGASEEVLGRALHELHLSERMTVVTKLRPLTPAEAEDADLAARAIAASVDESRRRLRLDCLPLVLFHREVDAAHLGALLELCERGLVERVGVSCDNEAGPAARFAATRGVSALQLPANILDGRHRRGGSIEAAAARGSSVFLRSIYLQGLLLMPEPAIPEVLRSVVPVRRTLRALAALAGLPLADLAVRRMLGLPGVTSLVVGVETVGQLRENLALFARGPLDAELAAAVDAAVPELPAAVLTPAQWPGAQR